MLYNDITQKNGNVKLKEYWANFILSFPDQWQWWATLTFPLESHFIHPETADKKFRILKHLLNQEIFGKKYYKHKDKGVIVIRANERQKNGNLHYHALISKVPNRISRTKYSKIWRELAGWCKIEDAKKPGAIANYMTKTCYMFKAGEIDIIGPADKDQMHINDPGAWQGPSRNERKAVYDQLRIEGRL
jgi:hypothetical protein